MIPAVIYARYSSHNQREESIEGQLRECHDFAAKNDLTIIEEYIDRAISGKTDQRPSFQRLIKDSEKKKFQAVIMYTLDRFARNRYDSAIYKAKLKKNGVKIYYAKQPMPDTPESIILESVMEGYAEYYSENLARSIKRGLKENALHGVPMATPPLGYKVVDKQYVIDPVGAKAVQEIYTQYLDGKSMPKIVEWLNENGFKTSRGTPFNKNSLPRILRNDIYIGTYRYMDVVIENHVPSIIDRDTYDRVQEALHYKTKMRAKSKANEDYLLTGKAFCGICGEPLVGESGRGKQGKMYYYYKCRSAKKDHSCPKHTEKKDWLEEIVVRTTVQKVLTDDNIHFIAVKVMELVEKESQDTSIKTTLESSLKDVNKRISNLMSAIEQGIITPTTKDRLTELEQERTDLETQIAHEDIKKPLLSVERVEYWLNQFKSGDITDIKYQRRVVNTLVNSVFVYDDPGGDNGRKIVIAFNLSGENTTTLKSSDIECSTPLDDANPKTLFLTKNGFGISISTEDAG